MPMKRVRRGPRTVNEVREGITDLVGERHTVADTAANKTGKSEEAVEDAIGSIGERDVLETSSTEVGDGTEHAYGGKAAGCK